MTIIKHPDGTYSIKLEQKELDLLYKSTASHIALSEVTDIRAHYDSIVDTCIVRNDLEKYSSYKSKLDIYRETILKGNFNA